MTTPGWHPFGPHEQMEMPVVWVITFIWRMGMEVILRVRFGIAHVARRIMFPLGKIATQHFDHEIASACVEIADAGDDPYTRVSHA